MNELPPVEEKRKIRVKTRVAGGRAEEKIPRLSRGRIAAVLILGAAVGILLGLVLGRGIKKMARVYREQNEITQSRPAFRADSAGSEPAAADSDPRESPGR
ncbi:MAG: hypothetical protein P9M08_02205 [Candidatus Erginobacter occultus]|nr:hypothetical protein [Candidatus Erginobacter occultus]